MRKVWIGLIVTLLVLLNGVGLTQAETEGKYVILLLDQLSLTEIRQYGGNQLIKLFEMSAQALLNVRTDQGIESKYTYQAFGAGSRGAKYDGVPGMIGQLLKEHNYRVGAYGNSDYGFEKGRQVVAIVMDNNGHLFFGDISTNLLQKDVSFPGDVRTDYEKMAVYFEEGYASYDLIAVEIGDINRIKTGVREGEVGKEELENLLSLTMQRIDLLLSRMIEEMDLDRDRLMLVAPTPDFLEMGTRNKLTWVMITGAGFKQGALVTATTRQSGVATISDLAPTILDHFQISIPSTMSGRPLQFQIQPNWDLLQMDYRDKQISRTSEWRPLYVKGFILVQIIILILAMFTFFLRKYISGFWWRMMSFLLLSVISIPFYFLIFSPYFIPSFFGYLFCFIGLVAGTAIILRRYVKGFISPVIVIITVTVLCLMLDIFRDAQWMSRSLLGYCPIIGARFYGIGNEFMGILVGGTLIGWTGFMEIFPWIKKRRFYLTPFVFGGVILLIGIPNLGANFGGTLTAMAAFTLTYILMFEKEKRFKIILISGTVLTFILALITISDAYGWVGERSHFGQTINLIKETGISAFFTILSRKLSMNLKLLRWTIWTRVLLVFIIVLVLLFKRPQGVLYELIQEYPIFAKGYMGVILGSVVTMIVNDSGVVAAATLLFFAILPLVYLVLKKMEVR